MKKTPINSVKIEVLAHGFMVRPAFFAEAFMKDVTLAQHAIYCRTPEEVTDAVDSLDWYDVGAHTADAIAETAAEGARDE